MQCPLLITSKNSTLASHLVKTLKILNDIRENTDKPGLKPHSAEKAAERDDVG